MIQTILVYLSTMTSMYFLCRKSYLVEKKSHRKSFLFLFLAIIIFSLVFGMRYYVGIDYHSYFDVYVNDSYEILRFEPGFMFLTVLIKNTHAHYVVYFSLLAFLQLSFFFFSFRKQKYLLPFLCIMLFMTGTFMCGWMNVIRQTLATTIFVFASSFLIHKGLRNLIIYLLLISLAISFHYSSAILLVIPIIWRFKVDWISCKKAQYMILLIAFLGQLLGINQLFMGAVDLLGGLFSWDDYLDQVHEGATVGAIGMYDILTFVLNLLVVSYSSSLKTFYKSDVFFPYVYKVGFFGIIVSYIFSSSMLISRMLLFFSIFQFPLYAYLFYYFNRLMKINRFRYLYLYVWVYFILGFVRVMMDMDLNTSRYVFYFQDELHPLKERLLNQTLQNARQN